MAHNYQRQDQLFHKVLHLPVALAAVSEAVRAILQRQFGRASLLIPNGVDCDRFFPGAPANAAPSAVLSSPSKGQVRGTPGEGWLSSALKLPGLCVRALSHCRCFPGNQFQLLPCCILRTALGSGFLFESSGTDERLC